MNTKARISSIKKPKFDVGDFIKIPNESNHKQIIGRVEKIHFVAEILYDYETDLTSERNGHILYRLSAQPGSFYNLKDIVAMRPGKLLTWTEDEIEDCGVCQVPMAAEADTASNVKQRVELWKHGGGKELCAKNCFWAAFWGEHCQ